MCTRRISGQIPAERGLTEQVDIEKGKVAKAVRKTSLEIKGLKYLHRNSQLVWFSRMASLHSANLSVGAVSCMEFSYMC
jgi:hypothetical protein